MKLLILMELTAFLGLATILGWLLTGFLVGDTWIVFKMLGG